MKRVPLTIALCLIFVAIIGFFPQNSIADTGTYSGAWAPAGQVSLTFDDTLATASTLSFYIYNLSNSDSLKLFNDGFFSSKVLYFSQSAGDWYASSEAGRKIQRLDLGASDEFGFYFYNKKTNTTDSIYGLTEVSASPLAVYQLTGPTESSTGKPWTVMVVGESPVPIPASAVLLGSGLFGLICVGFRKRKRQV